MRPLYLDFEFNRVTHENVNLVCCATYDPQLQISKKFWLHNSQEEKKKLRKYLQEFDTIVGYSCVAECRSFISLDINPLDWEWVDLFFEYRCITNHNDRKQWGKQLVDGKIKHVRKPKPKWERTEEDKATGFRATHSLSEATFNLTGEIRDTKHKTLMRDLIISDPEKFSDKEKKSILAYCLEDVIHLPKIFDEIEKEYKILDPGLTSKKIFEEAKVRGRYAAHTAWMENHGYPIDFEKTKNFSEQVSHILYDCQKEINQLFPKIKPFKWNRKDQRFTWDQLATRGWVERNCKVDMWDKTDGGKLSLSLDAFQRHFDFKHDHPTNNFGAQIVRFLKLKQNLYGFVPSPDKTKKNFWGSVGPDHRVRAYLNPFGAQSSRSQPGSTGFMFLKPAWMRALVAPEKGKFMAGIDYGSQEFFIQALLSKDEAMINAYISGDPYLFFAKKAGAIPEHGTKETHKIEREAYKATVLGISYLMTKYGLSNKLTNDTGKIYTEQDAQDLIDSFYRVFPKLQKFQERLLEDYLEEEVIRLPCVAKGSKIFTNRGIKNIEDLQKEDLIWDGVEWVKSLGVLPKGEKDVIHIEKMQLDATPDHWIISEGIWITAVEAREKENSPAQQSEKFLGDGRLLAQNSELKIGVSLVAAYVKLKKQLELNHCALEKLEPVLTALNLFVPNSLNTTEIAIYLMTNIFGENGRLATSMQLNGVETRIILGIGGMGLKGYCSNSNPLEVSWNILLSWMGIDPGMEHWTELMVRDTMKLETYELLAKKKTTKIEVYDILNCGPRRRFQCNKAIVHNCGWRMFGDNENHRSVTNVPIQGFGASVMRKAVDLAVERGVKVLKTLHDAIYIEGDVGYEEDILILRDAMREAFVFYLPDNQKEIGEEIRLDAFAWSPNYKRDSTLKIKGWEIETSDLYIDGRALREYENFSRYFENDNKNLL